LNDVKYVPNLFVNLCSLNKALKKGLKVSNDGVIVSLNYKHLKLAFYRVINATDGCVTGLLIEATTNYNFNGFDNVSFRNERTNDINYFTNYSGFTVKKHSTI
jgi:hypothetical protein